MKSIRSRGNVVMSDMLFLWMVSLKSRPCHQSSGDLRKLFVLKHFFLLDGNCIAKFRSEEQLKKVKTTASMLFGLLCEDNRLVRSRAIVPSRSAWCRDVSMPACPASDHELWNTARRQSIACLGAWGSFSTPRTMIKLTRKRFPWRLWKNNCDTSHELSSCSIRVTKHLCVLVNPDILK